VSNLVDELRERGFHVPNDKRPLSEVESGRIEAIRKKLLPGVGQAEIAQGVGFKSPETVKNWSDDPSTVTLDKAEKLVGYFASRCAEQYHIDEEAARETVLNELTKDADRDGTEQTYEQGMYCILSNIADYLLSDEMESLCDVAVRAVLDERRLQASQPDLAAFLGVAEAWKRLDKSRKGRSDARVIEAGNALRDALSAFNEAIERRPILVAEDMQSA
jgi:hypothetical protein